MIINNNGVDEIRPVGGKSTDSLPINELDTIDTIDSNTLFFVSRPLQRGVFRSYSLGYNQISSNIKYEISAFSDTKLDGKWEFNESSGGGLSANYKITDDNENGKLVLNTDYVSSRFLVKLAALSSEIFESNHMPSFVGQVIYSTTLRTHEKVKKYYGDYTEWEPVEGRFIMAAAQDGNVGQTTGDFETSLTINDTPTHSHLVIPQDNAKSYRLNWTLNPTTTMVCKKGGKSNGPDQDGDQGEGSMYMVVVDYNMENAVEWSYENKRQSWIDDYTIVVYGSSAKRGKGSAHVTTNIGMAQPHNNIPPFVTIFAWKRVR